MSVSVAGAVLVSVPVAVFVAVGAVLDDDLLVDGHRAEVVVGLGGRGVPSVGDVEDKYYVLTRK